ncbi:signal peptidase I [Bacillus mangrovi]|uniref:Signal peptidase I n=1 Tax=Metabacillus mangrovi TaxID=1491830 RepID=A0A7X2S7B3_9BACI|nr:signal peptidase I [Metabacillus mangrovi]
MGTKKEIYSWLKTIGLTLLIALLCRMFIFEPITVEGVSMSPTLENGNKVIASKISTIERFDVIIFNAPENNKKYIKRVIGLPGDKIEMKDDVLFVNGKAFKEKYINKEIQANKVTEDFSLKDTTGVTAVPDGYFFVLGDNRVKSMDSRSFGFISKGSVVGKSIFRIYPFTEFGITN